MPNSPITIRLLDSFMLTPVVKHFSFIIDDDMPFNYLPGQFVTIHFEKAGKLLKRSYSIACAPQKNNIIEFSASYVTDGPGTELLFTLQTNDTLQMTGPYGRLILHEADPQRYILIATSTGITPYRAMLPILKERILNNPALQVVILQGVQKSSHILFKEEFNGLSRAYPQFMFRAQLSRETDAYVLQENEFIGHVQTAFNGIQPQPTQDLVYLCGNPAMIDDTFATLKHLGFSTSDIIREKYISR